MIQLLLKAIFLTRIQGLFPYFHIYFFGYNRVGKGAIWLLNKYKYYLKNK